MIVALGATLANLSLSNAAGIVVTTQSDGSLAVKSGEKTVASFPPKTANEQRGKTAIREQTVSGHDVMEIRIPVRSEGPLREEVWIAERTSAGAKVIWWDIAGARDADGETSVVVKLSDKGIEEYQTAARLSRCDGIEVPLFRRTWDFTSRNFRAAAPTLPLRSATVVQGKRGEPLSTKPLGGFFFSAASSSTGTDGNAGRLRPPTAVNDSNPATVWATDGDGRGQLLTARSSGGFPITGLRVLPGDTSSEKNFRASAKPRKLTLLFSRDPAQNVDVELVEDADGGAKRFRQPYLIVLPKPVASSCITVLVREATSDKASLSIGDLDVLTELDGPEAADRLVNSLAQGTSCEARLPLLVRLGASALTKVAASIPKTNPGIGRGCLVDALSALVASGAPTTVEVATALVSALVQSTPDEERIIFKLLPALPGLPLDAIAAILADDKGAEADRTRAARVLAAVDNEKAHATLFDAVGKGDSSLRKSMRNIVAQLKAPAAKAALTALEATTDTVRRADLLLILGGLSAHEPEMAQAVLAALRAPLRTTAPFEEQARAIQGLGLLRQPEAVQEIIALRANNTDGVLRSLAIAELASAEGPDVLPALRAALDDIDPRVRETAASALGHKGDKSSAKLLIAGAKQEPWPTVRRAEIVALGEMCVTEGNQLLVRAFQRDVEEVRQAALSGIAHCSPGKVTPLLLRVLGRLPESADMRSLAARLLADRKDPKDVPALTEILERLKTESQADLSLEGVIADTAMALAAIRGPQAVSALVSLLSDTRPSVQRMAVEALGLVCDGGAGAAALRAASKNKDESVSIPAARAEMHCRERK
jgi:HEAT repeat protein